MKANTITKSGRAAQYVFGLHKLQPAATCFVGDMFEAFWTQPAFVWCSPQV